MRLSREIVITTLVGSLAVSPALIAGGVALLAHRGRSGATLRSLPVTVSPLVAQGGGGISLEGAL